MLHSSAEAAASNVRKEMAHLEAVKDPMRNGPQTFILAITVMREVGNLDCMVELHRDFFVSGETQLEVFLLLYYSNKLPYWT